MKEVKNEKELKHHTRRLSIKEGILWTMRHSFGDQYISPFAVAIGAKSSIITIINSLWNLGPASQLFGAKLVGKGKRKNLLKKTILFESLSWLFIAFAGFLYLKNLANTLVPPMIIIGIMALVFSNGLGYPSWFSLMGDLVDEKYRGRWWGKRRTIVLFTTVSFAIIAATSLNYLKSIDKEIFGFVVLFLIAAIARSFCIRLIAKHYEPEYKEKKKEKYFLKDFVKKIKGTNFGKFVLFRGLFALTIGITSPLVSIYLLRYLELDYLTYILIFLSGSIFSVITMNFWGKVSDIYGNYKVILLTTIFIPLTPILWILSKDPVYLFFVPAILGGTSWTAFLMASNNFIYDNIKTEQRGNAISYYNLFIGLGAFIGGTIGATLIGTIKTTWIEPLYLIFLFGSITRMIVVGIWIPKLKEIKKKQKLNNLREFEQLFSREIKPTLMEDFHEIREIPRYLKER